MSALLWGIKASFIEYIRAMADGSITAEAGANIHDAGAEFPLADPSEPLRFSGAVRFRGHGGVLDLRIADPAIEQRDGRWTVSIQDPYDFTARIDLATIETFGVNGQSAGRVIAGSGLALTANGADLFFGPYVEGTPLDNFEIRRTQV